MDRVSDTSDFAQQVFDRVKDQREGVAYVLITPDHQFCAFHHFDEDGQMPVGMAEGLIGSFIRDLIDSEVLVGPAKGLPYVEKVGF